MIAGRDNSPTLKGKDRNKNLSISTGFKGTRNCFYFSKIFDRAGDMIEAFTLATAHHFGDALASQARLRYKMFVVYQGLPHNHYAGLEYDEFDTPAAVYFVWRDKTFTARGVARLLPASRPYMMQTYWPELADGAPPSSPDIWELTCVCIDRWFPAAQRLRIFPEISAGVDEYCAMEGIKDVVGVTTPHFVKHHASPGFRRLGQPAGWLNRCRRLAKDWECLNRSALTFLRWSSIRMMMRRLCQNTK
jgi:acyl homoserine lactone synthase